MCLLSVAQKHEENAASATAANQLNTGSEVIVNAPHATRSETNALAMSWVSERFA